MGLMYLAVDKVPGYYEEQKFPDMESKVMLAGTIGAIIAYPSEKTSRLQKQHLDFLSLLGRKQ